MQKMAAFFCFLGVCIVMACNHVCSKLFVFRREKEEREFEK